MMQEIPLTQLVLDQLFGGQVVGGLRIRRQESAPTRKAAPSDGGNGGFDDMADDIPF
jgi:hypothetical protein